MKKTVFLLALCLMATTAMAEATCNGGTLITANKYDPESDNNVEGCDSDTCNGKVYCKSNANMNWWSAHAWCRSNGRKLASRAAACPNVRDGCPNLNGVGNGNVWTSTANGVQNAYTVNLSAGTVNTTRGNYYRAYNSCTALCE